MLEEMPGQSPPSSADSNIIRITDREFETLSAFVKEKYGIDLTKKRVLIEGRMSHELNKRGLRSFGQYLEILFGDKSGAEITLMLNRLTTNLSYFMRENEHFEYLQENVLPYLERARGQSRDLRIWSAGCSTGQEPYNMAMVIDEYFGAKKKDWDTTILATDISMNVLGKASQGIYSAEDIKNVSPQWKAKYFNRLADGQFQVNEKIRKEVIFRPFNLMEPFPFKWKFDFIFCRNVMIYFDTATKARLVGQFYDWMKDGGFLFIGHSESLSQLKSPFTYIQPAIYQKRG